MQSNKQSSGIHCKVATQNEIRRFFLPSADYGALLSQVCQFFGFTKDSVVIKYADDEGDFVTISSDEELRFAVEIAKDVLRLRVTRLQPTSPTIANTPFVPDCVNSRWRRNQDLDDSDEEPGRGKGWRERGKWHQNRAQMLSDPVALEKRIQFLTRKREKLQEKLASLESAAESGNSPHPFRREKIRQKLTCISTRLQHLTETASNLPVSSNPSETPAPISPAAGDAPPSPTPSAPLLSKQELQAQIETQQAAVGAARLALRQANLQLQLQRTNSGLISNVEDLSLAPNILLRSKLR
jgi:hypothetical protein